MSYYSKVILLLLFIVNANFGWTQSDECEEIKRKWDEQVEKQNLPGIYKDVLLKSSKHSESYFENLMMRCQIGKMYADDSTLLGYYRELMDTIDQSQAYQFFKAFSIEMFPVHLYPELNDKHWRILEMTNDEELILKQLILGARIYSTFTSLDESITLHDFDLIRKYIPDTSKLWLNFAGPCVSALKNNGRKKEVEPLLKKLYKGNGELEMLIHLFSFYDNEQRLKKVLRYKSKVVGADFLELYLGLYYCQINKPEKARPYLDSLIPKFEFQLSEDWESVSFASEGDKNIRFVKDKHIFVIAGYLKDSDPALSQKLYRMLAGKLELMPQSISDMNFYLRFGYDCGSQELRDKLEQQFNEKYIQDREMYSAAKLMVNDLPNGTD